MQPKYKRVLLKLSGEALAGEQKHGIDFNIATDICKAIKECLNFGVQVGIVVGGGNFWRGRNSEQFDRSRADHMGMLATLINALGLAEVFKSLNVEAQVLTSLNMQPIAEMYIKDRAVEYLEKGCTVIFACGTGLPFFSTDTASSLRAAEIGAEIILKATMVDGVYDKDPKKNSDAVRYESLSYAEMLGKNLGVVDITAASMCKENSIPLLVFSIENPQNIYDAIVGRPVGTIVR